MTDTKIGLDEEFLAIGLGEDITPAPAPAAEAETPPATDEIPAETKALLETVGLEHVPTVDEAKALLDARKAEIRLAVMREADLRDWCDDGTRKVCANLRLARPGDRENHEFQVELRLVLSVTQTAYTPDGALAKLAKSGVLSRTWIESHLYSKVAELDFLSARKGDEELDIAELKAKAEGQS